jgi:RNA polymerase sigma-70 factor (ECF subfamily)
MLRVVHNRFIDLAKQKKTAASRQAVTSSIPLDAIDSEGYSSGNNPVKQMEYSESQRIILKAMDSLPGRTREMLLLHYYQGLKYNEISEILDMNINSVKVAVHRGRKILRENLKDHFPGKEGR